MRAHLRSVRIAPKKASLVAALVRRMPVEEALAFLHRVPKKGARILHGLISSAAANAEHQSAQRRAILIVKSLVVQKGPVFRRSIPMARGRSRPIDKWTSHITVELGVLVPEGTPAASAPSPPGGEQPRPVASTPPETVVIHEDHAPGTTPLEHGVSPPVPEKRGRAPGQGRGASGPTFQPHRRGGRGS